MTFTCQYWSLYGTSCLAFISMKAQSENTRALMQLLHHVPHWNETWYRKPALQVPIAEVHAASCCKVGQVGTSLREVPLISCCRRRPRQAPDFLATASRSTA